MTVKFTNNASSSLSSGINSTATSLTVADASTFPSLSGADDYCYLTIQQATATGREVVKATARSGNTFTVQRGVDNTTAASFSSGDTVELRLTSALLQDVIDQATVEGIKTNFQYVPTAGQTQFSGADSSGDTMIINDSELVNVYMNGVRLVQGSDYTVSSANNRITLTSGATTADIIDIEVFGNFTGQSGAAVAITGGAIAGTAITTGSINNTPIGATQANTVAATTLTANSVAVTGNATIRSGNKLIINRADNAIGGEITYGPTGTGFIINDANGDDTIFKTGSTEHMRIDGGTGNVGISGALASKDITVTASSDSAHALSLQRASSSGRAQIRLLNESAAEIWRFGATGSGSSDFSFFDGGANVLVLKSSDDSAIFAGKVGIGAQTPDSLLELETAVTNATGGLLLTNTNASGYSTVQFRNTGGTAQTYTMALGGSSSAFPQKLYIYDDTDSAARVVLDHSGNLGVGVPSPATTLDVQGAIQARESGGDFIRMQTDGSNNIFDINSGDYVFRTAGFAQKFRISSAGNIGIGVTPSASHFTTLEIGTVGSGITGRGAADTHILSGLYWDGASTRKYAVSGVAVGTYQITNGIHYWSSPASGTAGNTATVSANMALDASGKLGISAGGSIFASRFSAGKPPNVTPGSVFTSSPSSFFSEATLGGTTGDSQKIAIFGGEDASNVSGLSIYRYRRSTGTNWLTDGFSLRQEVDSSANIYDYINFAGGKVGIGTSTPDYQLDIENPSTHAMARLHAGANSSASLRLQNDAQHWDVNLQTNDKFAIYDHTSGSQPFTILPTNNYVGIGRADPTQLLEVHKNSGGDQTVAKFSAHNYGDTGKTFIEIGTEVGDGSSRIGSFNSTGNRSVIVNELHDGTSGVFKEAFRLAMDSAHRRVVRFRVADVANSDFSIISNDDGTSQAGIHLFGSDQNHSIFFRRGYDNSINVMDFHQYGTFRFFNDGVLASQTKKAEIRPDGDFHVAWTGSADTTGYFYAGQDFGATNHRINRAVSQGNTVLVVSAYSGSLADSALFYGVSNGGSNTNAAAIRTGKNTVTSRSINSAGTINASGSDYAEYMEKKSTAFDISAGDVCGVNEDGKLTNKFTEAHSFVVKSTDPSYVGGDIWGSEDVIGKKPELTKQGYVNPEEQAPETDEEYAARKTKYETDLAAFEEALNAERIKYDRIAFSGQVPVNITGAKVGDYIVPKEKTGDLITAEAVTEPTFEQYQMAVGKVWKILEDGRAFISVKIG